MFCVNAAEKAAPELLTEKDYNINSRWIPHKTMSRDYWYVLYSAIIANDMEKYGNDSLFADAGCRMFVPPYQPHFSVFARSGGGIFAVALRGIKIFGPAGKNDLLQAKETTLSSATKFSLKKDDPAALKSGVKRKAGRARVLPEYHKVENLKKNKTYVSGIYHFAQEGSVSVDFGKPETVNKIIIDHGFKSHKANGKYWERNYLWIADHFVIQMKKGDKWVDIPGTEVKNNRLPETVSKFKPVTTNAIRIYVYSQNFSDVKYNYPKGEVWKWFITRKNKVTPELEERLKKYPFYMDYGRYLEREFVTYPPIQARAYKELKEKYPESFLGFQVGEWPEICKTLRYRIRGNKTGKGDDTIWKYFPRFADNAHNKIIPRPKTRQATYEHFRKNVKNEMKLLYDDTFLMDSYMHWHHYAAEWGSKILQHEQGGASPNSQMFIAFLRGAARQYNLPWWVYFPAFGPLASRADYQHTSGKKSVLKFGPDCGISASLQRRRTLMSYFAGANFITYEHDRTVVIRQDPKSEVKKLILSPHAKGLKDIKTTREKNLDRGVPYTPVAVLADFYHGLGNRSWVSMFWGYRWWNIKATRGDLMFEEGMFTLFPQLPAKARSEGPGWSLSNMPYGDIFDVILPNPPSGVIKSDVLKGYKALLILGDLKIEGKVKKLLTDFVRNGGTVILNSIHCSNLTPEFTGVKFTKDSGTGAVCRDLANGRLFDSPSFTFPKIKTQNAKVLYDDGKGNPLLTVNNYGKGKVILTLPDYLLDGKNKILPLFSSLMKTISREAVPVTVDGSIEYLENKTENGWVITLINNNGVYKKADSPPVIKPEEASKVTLNYHGSPAKVREWLDGSPVNWSQKDGKCTVNVTVPPGGVKVIEIINKH